MSAPRQVKITYTPEEEQAIFDHITTRQDSNQ